MLNRSLFITVRVRVTGFHHWGDAVEEVSFLKNLHRHTFTCEASVWVNHGDRQVEFTILKKHIEGYLNLFPDVHDGKDFDNMSCEQLSDFVVDYLLCEGFNVRHVSFSEDGEFEGGCEIKET